MKPQVPKTLLLGLTRKLSQSATDFRASPPCPRLPGNREHRTGSAHLQWVVAQASLTIHLEAAGCCGVSDWRELARSTERCLEEAGGGLYARKVCICHAGQTVRSERKIFLLTRQVSLHSSSGTPWTSAVAWRETDTSP